MDKNTRTRIEYEHQHFGFSSEDIIDSFQTMLSSSVNDTLTSVVEMLRRKLSPAVTDQKALETALQTFLEKMEASYERGAEYAMESVQGQIRECFRIPDSVLLPEDKVVATVEGIDEDLIDQEIADLKEELKVMAFIVKEAQDELDMQDGVLEQLENAAGHDFVPLPEQV